MGKLKKIGIIFGVPILAFFVLMAILAASINPEPIKSEIREPESAEDVRTASKITYLLKPERLLPTLEDLPLNWRVGETSNDKEKLFKMVLGSEDREQYQIDNIGLRDSISQKYTKLGTPDTWEFWSTVYIYQFQTHDQAKLQYDNIIDFQNKNKAFDVVEQVDICRTIQESRTWSDLQTQLCIYENLVILIENKTDVAIGFYDSEELYTLLKIITDKLKNL